MKMTYTNTGMSWEDAARSFGIGIGFSLIESAAWLGVRSVVAELLNMPAVAAISFGEFFCFSIIVAYTFGVLRRPAPKTLVLRGDLVNG